MDLVTVFKKSSSRTPCWFMRQAGRYLPEYRQLRTHCTDFLKFCLTPSLIKEATLQPLKRFDIDAAIIFSDILVLLHALGQKIWFEPENGPCLEPQEDLLWDRGLEALFPVYEGISDVRQTLNPDLALIGFAGAPYTLACYMFQGKSTRSFSKANLYGFQFPDKMDVLLDRLSDNIIVHLQNQADAGCNVLQIFESWASNVPDTYVGSWLIRPVKKIIAALRKSHPQVPLLVFAKNMGNWIPDYVQQTQLQGIGLSSSEKLTSLLPHIPSKIVLQGALDPYLLVAGGESMRCEIERQLELFRGRRHVFNLGHGIVPETPPEHVEEALKCIRRFS